MGRGLVSHGWIWPILGLAVLMVVIPAGGRATVYVINFGGALGKNYSPNSLSVSVGDTVEWQGSFGDHPLHSTSAPQGAATWENVSGSVFDYVVTVPGSYNYECENHGPAMSGSFTATATAVDPGTSSRLPAKYELLQNYPNPFNPSTTIGYSVPGPGSGWVKLTVYNLIGQELATLVNERKPAGSHITTFDASGLPSGVYVYKLNADGVTRSRTMIVMR